MKKEPACRKLTEEEIAMAICPDYGGNGLEEVIPEWMSAHCTSCSRKLHRLLRIRELVNLVPPPVSLYTAWFRVDLVRRRFRRFRKPQNLLARLDDSERLALVVHLLVEEEELRFDSPREGLAAMELAWEAVSGFEEVSSGQEPSLVDVRDFEAKRPPSDVSSLVALVKGRYGNALRYNSRLHEALRWTAAARLVARSREIDPVVYAEVHSLAASAFVITGQVKPALEAIRDAVETYERCDRDSHRAAVARIQLGEILFRAGREASTVIQVFEESLSKMDVLRAPDKEYGCRLAMVYCNLKADQCREAESIWQSLSPTRVRANDVKRRALGGLIHLEKRESQAACTLLRPAVEDFVDLGRLQEAAVFLLYLGEALIREGELASGVEGVEQAHQLFCRLGVDLKDETNWSFDRLLNLSREASTASEWIRGLRRLARGLGGCLPLREGETSESES